MQNFKFLNDNKKDDFLIPTEDEIVRALELGREHYLNGHGVEDNPFIRQELYEAFNEGWDLEYSYDILRQARDRANNGL